MLKLKCANNRLSIGYIRSSKDLELVHLHGKKFINNSRLWVMDLNCNHSAATEYFSDRMTVTSVFDLDIQMLKVQRELMNNGISGAYSSRNFKSIGSALFGTTDGRIETMHIEEHQLYIEGKKLW